MISLSNLFEVLGVYCISATNCVDVPILFACFVTAQNQVGIPPGIEGEEDAVGPSLMLNPQFLQVWELRPFQRVDVRPSEFGTESLKHADTRGHTCSFVRVQAGVPRPELVADFHFPSYDASIPSKLYAVKGISQSDRATQHGSGLRNGSSSEKFSKEGFTR